MERRLTMPRTPYTNLTALADLIFQCNFRRPYDRYDSSVRSLTSEPMRESYDYVHLTAAKGPAFVVERLRTGPIASWIHYLEMEFATSNLKTILRRSTSIVASKSRGLDSFSSKL